MVLVRLPRLFLFGFSTVFLTMGTNIRQSLLLLTGENKDVFGDTFAPPPLPLSRQKEQKIRKRPAMLVTETDSIWRNNSISDIDLSPIVLEDYRLVFFPSPPSTLWKKLLRRMQGYHDWKTALPHDPKTNGLKYLRDFNISRANEIMSSPDFTRVIFVRDPKEKFYSMYQDTVQQKDGNFVLEKCCPEGRDCLSPVSPESFLNLTRTCRDQRWIPQQDRMEHKYWEYINFVGHWENVEEDARRLMEHLNVWNDFGISGWGPHGRYAVTTILNAVYQPRRRFSQMSKWYTKQLERYVEDAYERDYDNAKLGFKRTEIVHENDFIYKRDLTKWDAAPIVAEEFKLIFFTVPKVACTTWKQLFRRIQGVENWQSQDPKKFLPHNPERNNLTYLWDYDIETANRMMTSPSWTKAIFVRDPKERFLSAFLDKALRYPEFIKAKCCRKKGGCVQDFRTPAGFLALIQTCHNNHWSRQNYRIENKYWPYINFVGKFESQQEDAKQLLKKVGAWNEYGKSGWGASGELEIFQKASNTQNHATNSKSQAARWLTPELERRIELYYEVDYVNPKFGFVKSNLTGIERTENSSSLGQTMRDYFYKLVT